MIPIIGEGIQRIIDTKKYAYEKNVTSWITSVIISIAMILVISSIFTILTLIFLVNVNPNKLLVNIFVPTLPIEPFLLTFLIMITFGHYPIKLFILFVYYINKGIMKLIDKLDMIIWKKTGKDGVASKFVTKYRHIIQILMYIPVILSLLTKHWKF